ncbi:MAG: hypothetical protein ACR2J6_00915 [Thermoleophilaceae bacterium]
MTSPEEAQGVADEAARLRRAAGGYAGVGSGGELDATIVSGEPSRGLLARWAVIEVEPDEILYSTRSGGAPITWVKRLLLRLLRQYFVELEACQTRFNIALLERLDALEARAAPGTGEQRGATGGCASTGPGSGEQRGATGGRAGTGPGSP